MLSLAEPVNLLAQHLSHWGLGSVQTDKVFVRCLVGERCVRELVVKNKSVRRLMPP